jgi:hypothetical protein
MGRVVTPAAARDETRRKLKGRFSDGFWSTVSAVERWEKSSDMVRSS